MVGVEHNDRERERVGGVRVAKRALRASVAPPVSSAPLVCTRLHLGAAASTWMHPNDMGALLLSGYFPLLGNGFSRDRDAGGAIRTQSTARRLFHQC